MTTALLRTALSPEFLALVATGITDREIARKLSVSPSCVRRWRKHHRLSPSTYVGPRSRIDEAELRRLSRLGLPGTEIGRRMGFSRDAVNVRLRRLGLTGKRRPLEFHVRIRDRPCRPTDALPGTPEKVAVIEGRIRRMQRLHHPDDARGPERMGERAGVRVYRVVKGGGR